MCWTNVRVGSHLAAYAAAAAQPSVAGILLFTQVRRRARDRGEFVIDVVKFMLHAGRIIMGTKVWGSISCIVVGGARPLCFWPPPDAACACQRLCMCGMTPDPRRRPLLPFVAPVGGSSSTLRRTGRPGS